MNQFKDNNRFMLFKLIQVYIIGTSIFGIIVFVATLFDNDINYSTAELVALLLLSIAGYLFCLFNFRSLKENHYPMTLKFANRAFFLLQVVNFNIFGVTYLFTYGPELILYTNIDSITTTYSYFLMQIYVLYNTQVNSEFILGINLIPLSVFMLSFLRK